MSQELDEQCIRARQELVSHRIADDNCFVTRVNADRGCSGSRSDV